MAWDDELRALLPPPAAGLSAEPDQWGEIEGALGLPIPSDYKTFIRTWGPGVLAGEILFLADREAPGMPDLGRHALAVADAYRHSKENFPDKYAAPLLPDPGSLLSFGRDGNGDQFGWIVGSGPAEEWSAAILVHEDGVPTEFDGPFGAFILALCRKELERLPAFYSDLDQFENRYEAPPAAV